MTNNTEDQTEALKAANDIIITYEQTLAEGYKPNANDIEEVLLTASYKISKALVAMNATPSPSAGIDFEALASKIYQTSLAYGGVANKAAASNLAREEIAGMMRDASASCKQTDGRSSDAEAVAREIMDYEQGHGPHNLVSSGKKKPWIERMQHCATLIQAHTNAQLAALRAENERLAKWVQNELGWCRTQPHSKAAVYILERMQRDFVALTPQPTKEGV